MVVLDYNEKHSINKVLEVLIGVGTYTSTSRYFLLGSSIQCLLFVGFEATSHKSVFAGDGENVSVHSGWVFFRQGDTKFMYRFNK